MLPIGAICYRQSSRALGYPSLLDFAQDAMYTQYGRQSGERRDGGVARARNHMFDMSQVEVFERMDHGVPWMGQPRLAVT